MKELDKYIQMNRKDFDSGELPQGHRERFLEKLERCTGENLPAGLFPETEKPETRVLHRIAEIQGTDIKHKKPGKALFTGPTVKTIGKVLSSLAAVFLLAFFIGSFFKHERKEEDKISLETVYLEKLEKLESQIVELSRNVNPETGEYVLNTLDNILFEAIPLPEQLPGELSREEKAKIMKDYYSQKMQGVRKLKIFLAQEATCPDK